MTSEFHLPDNRGNRPLPNSYWVIPGRFAAGEYPGAMEAERAATKLNTLLSAGIDHFIDLTEPGELAPYVRIAEEEARNLGLTVAYERHPIVDGSVPRNPEQMAKVLDAIDAALNDQQDHLYPLLGRGWPDRHRGWLLAGAARTHGRRRPSPASRVVAGSGKGLPAAQFTGDIRAEKVCPQLDRGVAGYVTSWVGKLFRGPFRCCGLSLMSRETSP